MVLFQGKAPLTSDLAFVLEIAVLIILFFGRFRMARKGRFVEHGVSMTIAVILHAISVFLVMIPSLVVSANILFSEFSNPAIVITWIHMPIGLVSLFCGIFLVTKWRFRPPEKSCYSRWKMMRPVFWLWVLSSALGILIYLAIAFP